MERPAGMPFEPGIDRGMLVGGVVVDDGFNQFAGGHRTLDIVEEADELFMPILLHAATDDAAITHVERCEQGCRAVALIVMGHCAAAAWLQWQPWLSAIEHLDLTSSSIDSTTACDGGST